MPYNVGNDPYIDKETGVLRNLLGIRSQQELDRAEAELTSLEITELLIENDHIYTDFNEELFFAIHMTLFREIYGWAGELRTVEISKGDTSFARVEYLGANMHQVFVQLQNDDQILGNNFIDRLAYYYSELIILHPFREGNGRAIRTFLAMLAESLGWHIAWDEMKPETNIEASKAAYRGDEKPMQRMLRDIIEPIDPFWGRDPYEFIDNY